MTDNSVLDAIYGPLARHGVELFGYDWLFSNLRCADIFHIHWPDATVMGESTAKALVKLGALLISALRYRFAGAKIIYTVHNIGSHDRKHPRLESLLWRVFLPFVSTFIHMNRDSRERFVAHFPATAKRRHAILYHPAYVSPRTVDRLASRRRLGLPKNATVFLSCGLLRSYKGIEDIVVAFREFHASEAVLLVAGRVDDPDYGRSISALVAADPRIRLIARFLSDEELDEYLAACDVVTMAHRSMNNSGVALLALSRGRPLVAPAHPAIVELRDNIGGAWVTTFNGPISAEVLALAARGREGVEEGPNLSAYEPKRLSDGLLTIFEETVDG